MKITVMSRDKAVKYSWLPHNEKTYVISIMTPWAAYGSDIFPSPYNGIKSVIRLFFDDVESGTNCMDETHAKAIKKFVELHKDGNFIVQCDAGVSRSAGVAAALMKFYNGDDTPIFDNKKYCPNMLCYRTMLNELMEGKE